jgi:chromosomal replication initiator protein
MTKDTWGQVCNALQKTIGRNNYLTWIEPLRLKDLSDGIARFDVPTNFMRDWVSRNYGEQIRQQLIRRGVEVDRVEFMVSAPAQLAPEPKPVPIEKMTRSHRAKAVARSDDADLPAAPLDARFTFDSFVVGKPNELAHAAARRVAEGGPVTFNPLFLYGGVGLGKTHLMHAIAHELQARQPELRVLYLSAEQFMYRFIQALREKQIMDFKELFRSVDVLMVDDVQFIAGKDSTQEEFFHTFNALVDQNKQIIISADRAPGEIKDLEERIKSRLQCGLVVDLHPTDYELRLGILQQKAEMYRQQYPGLTLSNGVLEFLAHRITTNVRVLEGALTRLFAFASLVGREITLDLAQDCLADILRASDRKVTIEEIQRKVAEHYNIRLADMIGPKRVRTIARPRQVAMYLSKHMTTRSLPEIGRRFGGRDHTTIMHGIRKVEELRGSDSQLREDLDLLRRLLEA